MKIVFSALVLSASLLTITAHDARAQDKPEGPAPQATGGGLEIESRFAFDFTTQYFYRGMQQENGGFIVQPSLEFSSNAYEGDTAVSRIDWTVGLWNSLHEGNTGAGGGASMWYESDFYMALDMALPKNLLANTRYFVRHSPNGRFGTVQELQFTLAWDDSGSHQGKKFGGLRPHVNISFETSGGSDLNRGHGTYAELGITPTYQATDKVRIAAPVVLGFSMDDYYENAAGSNDTFGYLSFGFDARMPLDFPIRFGPWELNAGLEMLFLGDNNETRNGGDGFEIIGTIGMSLNF